jgi:hypothetical protein
LREKRMWEAFGAMLGALIMTETMRNKSHTASPKCRE